METFESQKRPGLTLEVFDSFEEADAEERRRNHAMTPVERAQLARLAQGTPPQSRAALRGELLSTATDKRGAWLQQRLER